MSSMLAAAAGAVVIILLFRFDRKTYGTASAALWTTALWVAIGASRNVSQWLGGGSQNLGGGTYADGSPIDRNVQIVLLSAMLIVLTRRGKRVSPILKANWALLLYYGYCLCSVAWSEFPLVAFKRWTKGVGDVGILLVVLTGASVLNETRLFFARPAFVLVPASIVTIRYFPAIGRTFSKAYEPMNIGVADHKNSLGAFCLIFGLTSLWWVCEDVIRNGRVKLRPGLIAHLAVVAMCCWLLQMANSATATGCAALGAVVLVGITAVRRRARMFTALVLAALLLGGVSAAFPDLYSTVVKALGRKEDLTGRTDIWATVLAMKSNPVVGMGYESFWLGDRLERFEASTGIFANEAHNGYLEIYLNLGWMGLALLSIVGVTGYWYIRTALQRGAPGAPLKASFFMVALAYNLTEAAFKMMSPVGLAFLLSVIAVPTRRSASQVMGRGADHELALRGLAADLNRDQPRMV